MRAWPIALFLAGCAPTNSGSTTTTDAGSPARDAGPPAVHFLVDERPHDPHNPEVDAVEARYGDPIRVIVRRLTPHARANVRGRMNGMRSEAVFDADAQGTVDLGRDAPVEGGWSSPDVDGIFWSMTQVDPAPSTLDLDLDVEVNVDGTPVATGRIHRRYINDGLVTENVSTGRTQGRFARPDGDGPFPGVLVFGGSEGGTGTGVFAAMYLASLGYAALGVGYFGATGLPPDLENVPIEILEEDLRFLAAHDHVDGTRLAVMGGSRGGELALILGARFPDVKAVVAEVPSGVAWGSTVSLTTAAWTFDGTPLPFIPSSGAQPEVRRDGYGRPHHVSRGTFLADLAAASPEALAAATIHVEDTHGPVLLYGGADDQLWPSCELAQIAYDRLVSSGHAANGQDRMLCLPGTGHAVGQPGWSTMDVGEVYEPSMGGYLVLGGNPDDTGRAQRVVDTAVRGFLERALGP